MILSAYHSLDALLLIIQDYTIEGRTRIQKYAFYINREFCSPTRKRFIFTLKSNHSNTLKSLKFYDDWDAGDYGPFSQNLYHDLPQAVKYGYIIEEKVTRKYGDVDIYYLSKKGEDQLNKLCGIHANLFDDVYRFISSLQKKSLTSILKDIYLSWPDYTIRSKIRQRVLSNS